MATDGPNVQENKWLYRFMVSVWATVSITLIIFMVIAYFRDLWGITETVLAFVVAGWAGLTFKVVPFSNYTAMLIFGIPASCPSYGIILVPFFPPIMKWFVVDAGLIEVTYPGPKSTIFGESDDVPLPPGMVRPMRITTGGPTTISPEPLDATDAQKLLLAIKNMLIVQQTVGMVVFCSWKVDPDKVFSFVLTTENDVDQMNDRLGAFLRAELTHLVSQKTLGELIAQTREISKKLLRELKKEMENYGVILDVANVDAPDISRKLAGMLRDLNASFVEAQTTIVTAQAEGQKRMLEGKGAAKARQALVEADGLAAARIALETNISASDAFSLKVVSEALSGSTTLLPSGASGLADIFALIKAAQAKAQGSNNP